MAITFTEVGTRKSVVTRIVDLSVPLYNNMPTDDLGPVFWTRLSHAASRRLYGYTQSREGRVFLTTDHVGTHLNGPLRYDPHGDPVELLDLARLVRPARVLDLRAIGRSGRITRRVLEQAATAAGEPRAGDAIVLWTGHDKNLHDPSYFWVRPVLTVEGAEWIGSHSPAIVAADFTGFGAPDDELATVPRILHRSGAVTVEQLCNLSEVAHARWHLAALPLRLRGVAGSLIRAVALVDFTGGELVDLSLDTFSGMTALGGAVPTFWTRASHPLTGRFLGAEHTYQTNAMLLSEHAGTHLDAPYHFDEGGLDAASVPLERLLAPARVFDLRHKGPLDAITVEDLEVITAARPLREDEAAVIATDHWRRVDEPDYPFHRPFITSDAAAWIARRHPRFLATDLIGLDEPIDETTPVHLQLLRAGVPQVQVLGNLQPLMDRADAFIGAFPLKLTGGTGSPVRAFAVLA